MQLSALCRKCHPDSTKILMHILILCNLLELSDYSGHENLDVLSQTHRFNDWIFEHIRPCLNGDILEIGSGIGTFSEKIIRNLSANSSITLTDVSLKYVRELEERFLTFANKTASNMNDHSSPISVYKLDLNSKEDYELIGYERFDSIIAINVLEHVENDEFALQQLHKMLRRDGLLVALVPCHKFLYNALDRQIGHFRRYTKREFESKVNKSQFTIENLYYFNILGIVGWFLTGSLARRTNIGGSASRVFDKIVPFSKYLERITNQKIGLSMICYLSKR